MKRIVLDGDSRDFLRYRWGSGGTIEIYDIAVNSERGVGKGRRLVNLLVERVSTKTHLIFAITRQSNRIARQFYEAVGFSESATLKGFYMADGEDGNAVVYTLKL